MTPKLRALLIKNSNRWLYQTLGSFDSFLWLSFLQSHWATYGVQTKTENKTGYRAPVEVLSLSPSSENNETKKVAGGKKNRITQNTKSMILNTPVREF